MVDVLNNLEVSNELEIDPMQEDVKILGRLLGQILLEDGGQDLLDDVEKLRSLSIQSYKDDDEKSMKEAQELISSFSLERAYQVARAFTVYFHLANLVEENYRVKVLDSQEDNPSLFERSYQQLVDEIGKDKALDKLSKLQFRPILTAHPTEARRRSINRCIRRISHLLRDKDNLTKMDVEFKRALLEEIDILWQTAPLRESKPTVIDEVKRAIDIFDSTFFDTIPNAYRHLDDQLLNNKVGLNESLIQPFVFLGTWIGGDRDGNPNVTPQISIDAATFASRHVLTALHKQAKFLAKKITVSDNQTPPSYQLLELWNQLKQLAPQEAIKVSHDTVSETHRNVLSLIAYRIEQTKNRHIDLSYKNPEDLIKDLKIVQDSLVNSMGKRIAYGDLQKLIWQVQSFGFHLAELEVRQHSQVLQSALDEINDKGVLSLDLSNRTLDVIDTFRAIKTIQDRFGLKAARRFIVSFTQSSKHLALVYQLNELIFPNEKDRPIIDAIPLFETFADLQASVSILDELIKMPQVIKRLEESHNNLEVMLGYSDSSKDVGPVSAILALHKTQVNIVKWAKDKDITLTLFHGRGGSLGRGGGPANRALLAQPPGSVDGRFKLTEQGEVILARYGDAQIAQNHIEEIASAMLLADAPSIQKRNEQTTIQYQDLANQLDEVSRKKYLSLVNCDGFPSWFAQVTPMEELGLMTIGSRPAKRGLSLDSLDDLRAIPWVFSWSQARLNLAGWFGLGSALKAYVDNNEEGLIILQEAFRNWPLFRTMIDNIEMSLSKVEVNISKMYLAMGDRNDLSQMILDELDITNEMVLKILGISKLLETRPVLGKAVLLRAPYINALSLLQVNALSKLRKETLDDLSKKQWQELLLITVNGVSAGLQNTG